MNSTISIIKFQDDYAKDFASLNYEWLEKYFVIEPHDTEMLENPKEYIIDKGGEIFLAKIKDEIVGTVALIKIKDGEFELAKMAVTEKYKGCKIGHQLMEATINYAKEKQINSLMLESNRKLKPALYLYKKFGFKEVPTDPNSPYERADIKMVLKFN
ncbi:GNAT family N-acetyltransferase [Pseudofulvibacter geojedonensis]|uniref:GNAT family N-acetyltransferase n=1 Tax=Pseudofulvibacter geojedonensis TaxID=1123758 RepID=A0ABW3I2K1_9FLAO